MAFVLNAIIGKGEVIVASDLPVIALDQGFGLVPLTTKFWRSIEGWSNPLIAAHEWAQPPFDCDVDDDGNPHFTIEERARNLEVAQSAFDYIAKRCAKLSIIGPVAYLEAGFFGGGGMQGSAVWANQSVILGPLVQDLAMNLALAKIGVVCTRGDEFETLHLGRFRFTEDWFRPVKK
jgi:hypothetical protein